MKCFLMFLCLSSTPKNHLEKRAEFWAEKYKLPAHTVKGLIEQESRWNPEAVSDRGAKGLMQVMEPTAVWLGKRDDEDLLDPDTNLHYGCKYLRYLLDLSYHNKESALMAYYAGPSISAKTYVHRVKSDSATYSYSVLNKSLMYIGNKEFL